MKMDAHISTLIGVGSSICGGSAIAATAPVIAADDEEIAQAENCGAQAITLGRRILRTETAGMAVLAMLGYVLEE